MKNFMYAIVATVFMVSTAAAQTYECFTVPKDHKVEFVYDPPREPEQPPSATCVTNSTTVCASNVAAADWASKSTITTTVTIPRGRTVASRIKTSTDPSLYGGLNFQTPVGGATPTTNVWVSYVPNGPAISDYCKRGPAGFIYSLKWSQTPYKRNCYMEPNKVYYLNMKHVDVNAPASKIIRDITATN
jgi:hypothetical protein